MVFGETTMNLFTNYPKHLSEEMVTTLLDYLEGVMMNPDLNDPVIDEIREVRHGISERFAHDPARLVAYYMELQEKYRDRLIDSAKTPEPTDQ